MTQSTVTSDTVDTVTVLEFLAVLAAIVLGFIGFTQTMGIEIITLRPVYMFTPAVAGFIVCLHHGISLPSVGLRIGHRHWLPIAALLPVPILFTASFRANSKKSSKHHSRRANTQQR